MDINVSTSMGFENRNFLKKDSQDSQNSQNSHKDSEKKQSGKHVTLPASDFIYSSELNSIYASSQIKLNDSLKETLTYLKKHSKDRAKKHIFGELWEKMNQEKDEYNIDTLIDFVIDNDSENIFAA